MNAAEDSSRCGSLDPLDRRWQSWREPPKSSEVMQSSEAAAFQTVSGEITDEVINPVLHLMCARCRERSNIRALIHV